MAVVDDTLASSPYLRFMGYSKRAVKAAEREQALAQSKTNLRDVFMLFEKQESVWRVSFTRPLGQGQFPRGCHFADPDKIRSLFERFGSRRLLEDRAAFENALMSGRGVVMLSLGREQYSKLLRKG